MLTGGAAVALAVETFAVLCVVLTPWARARRYDGGDEGDDGPDEPAPDPPGPRPTEKLPARVA